MIGQLATGKRAMLDGGGGLCHHIPLMLNFRFKIYWWAEGYVVWWWVCNVMQQVRLSECKALHYHSTFWT